MKDDLNLNERGYACLATSGTTPTITKVINLAFQDEASPYGSDSGGWTITTPRTSTFNVDITTLRDRIDNNPPNYILGEYFQVATQPTGQYLRFKQLLQAVEGGTGQYVIPFGLSDKPEIHNTYDVVPGQGQTTGTGPGSPQYYTDLIITAINNLGYNIPPCNQTPTPTPTPTSTPIATSTLNISGIIGSCSRGSISIVKNSTTIYTYTHSGNTPDTENPPGILVSLGDTIEIFASAQSPVGAGCVGQAFFTDTIVQLDNSTVINVSNSSSSHSFTAINSSYDIDFTMTVS